MVGSLQQISKHFGQINLWLATIKHKYFCSKMGTCMHTSTCHITSKQKHTYLFVLVIERERESERDSRSMFWDDVDGRWDCAVLAVWPKGSAVVVDMKVVGGSVCLSIRSHPFTHYLPSLLVYVSVFVRLAVCVFVFFSPHILCCLGWKKYMMTIFSTDRANVTWNRTCSLYKK